MKEEPGMIMWARGKERQGGLLVNEEEEKEEVEKGEEDEDGR